ncbi:MAG: hypothetical protein HeimC3_22630 [Candidatus Heimdallarchaeota archaeon LC_3]|nr:MAG: hypothetical protein HeimC3_22630 [Candidatus Heimdallarchaeota archaeon LC_3]
MVVFLIQQNEGFSKSIISDIQYYEMVIIFEFEPKTVTIVLNKQLTTSANILRILRKTIKKLDREIKIRDVFSDQRNEYLDNNILGKEWVYSNYDLEDSNEQSSEFIKLIEYNLSIIKEQNLKNINKSKKEVISGKNENGSPLVEDRVLDNIDIIDILEEVDKLLKPLSDDDKEIVRNF